MAGDSRKFITALKDNDLAAVREVPKADLHNHIVLGGSRTYIYMSRSRFSLSRSKSPWLPCGKWMAGTADILVRDSLAATCANFL